MEKITAFFTALVIFLSTAFGIFLPKVTAPVSRDELLSMQDTIKKKELPDEVYFVDLGGFSQDEIYSAIALQGIVAKQNPCIYLNFGYPYTSYLEDIEAGGKTVIRTDENGNKWTYESLVNQFKSYIGDCGYTLYKNTVYAEELNAATNYATAYGWLPVPQSVKDKAESCGLTLKKDLTGAKDDYAFQRKCFNELKDYFEKGTLVHLKSEPKGLRDLAISQGYFCFYTLDDNGGDNFMREVLRWSGKNTSVYGWCEHEKHSVEIISKAGGHMNATDFCYNCSYLSQLESKTEPVAAPAVASSDEGKHYVTLVFSDGDNCQWLQNGYGEFYTAMRLNPGSEVTWTFSPVIRSFCPPAFDRITAAAGENTTFVCGPSGFGYTNPSRMDSKSLDLFSTETASAMLKSGQSVITILDDYKPINDAKIARSFDWFSRFDNIDGGILYLDPDRYTAGKGRVWFSNDKPFASVRLSLWHTDGYDGATDEWISEQADIINSYPVDIHSADGYSVICIHAWTMKPEAVEKFVSMLSDHVEILSAADFLKTMSENIPHKNVTPNA